MINKYSSPLGEIVLASDGAALTGLWFEAQKYFGGRLTKQELENAGTDEVLERAGTWLDAYFGGDAPELSFELAPAGTTFQKAVWAALLKIPYGETKSYGELAESIGCKSARAVGTATGRNPISIIIPCHRLVGANGSLTGYAGGLERKKALLEIERNK